MGQLPHAAVGIAVFVSDVILGVPIDEDGSQRLVLTMVGRGIGVQEEPSATGGVHGCTLECELVSSDSSTRTSYQTGSPRPSRTAFRACERGEINSADRPTDRMTASCLPKID
jgi:hypothetical protein